MPESLSSPQMLGNAPAHNALASMSSPAVDLFRQLFHQQQQLHQQALQLQQQQQNEQQKKEISEATIRSSTSSPDGHIKTEPTSPDGEEDEGRPESVESSSPTSPPPTSTSRSSSRGNNPNSIRPQRKLKIYGVEEKLDIIDYAKIIGNRAAGREYNVAESSIRDWRKNEIKLRNSAENARATQNPNPEKEAFYEKLYEALVTYINAEGDGITWKMVRDKCKELWEQWGNGFPEGQVSMHLQGWVARFIQKARQAKEIPEVPPPISSTNASANSTCMNGITMVPTTSAVDFSTPSPSSSSIAASTSQPPPAKRSRTSNASNNQTTSPSKDTPASTSKPSKSSSSFVTPQLPKSRRKNVAPKRVIDATVKTSTTMPLDLSTRKSSVEVANGSSKKLSSDVENDEAAIKVKNINFH
jgi:hypothetical protein